MSRIVQEHQGVIRVEDNRPRGARFVVRTARRDVDVSLMRESILIVDDEAGCAAR